MQIHNTTDSYGIVAKTLHWVVALLIITAWIVGYYAVDLPNKDPQKGLLFMLHKSVGMVILMLVVIRLSWRLYDGTPRFSETMNRLIATAARTVHYLLYAFMFIQPLSGWAMSSAAGHNPTFFGLFPFPGLVPQDPTMAVNYMIIHNVSAMILLTLFILHVGGALTHHFILKDNTLRRMTVD
jgi:cytochrome b561